MTTVVSLLVSLPVSLCWHSQHNTQNDSVKHESAYVSSLGKTLQQILSLLRRDVNIENRLVDTVGEGAKAKLSR